MSWKRQKKNKTKQNKTNKTKQTSNKKKKKKQNKQTEFFFLITTKKVKTGKETTNSCALTRVFLSVYTVRVFLLVFSPSQGENILVGPKRKLPSPSNFFSSPPSNQTPTKNIFYPLFSPTFSILYKIFPTKQTLNIFR